MPFPLFLAALVVVSEPGAAPVERPSPRVALLPLGGDAGGAMAARLRKALAAAPIALQPASTTAQTLEAARALGVSCAPDTAPCAARLGELAGVDVVLGGEVKREAGGAVLLLRAVDVHGGRPRGVQDLAIPDDDTAGSRALRLLAIRILAPDRERGRIAFHGMSGASVIVDSVKRGTTPIAPIEVAPGKHKVYVALAGHESLEREIVVEFESETAVEVELAPDGSATTATTPPTSATTPKPAKEGDDAKPAAGARVFFSRIRAQEGIDAKDARVLDDAVLVAAKELPHSNAVGISDLQGVLDAAAQKAAVGCDDVECATEVADALNAPQLVTGGLGRVGTTWVLTLTRIERSTLTVLARSQVQHTGSSPDALLSEVPAAVRRLMDVPDPSPLPLIGGIAAGSGIATALAGGALVYWSSTIFDGGITALTAGDRKSAAAARATGEPIYDVGWVVTGLGAMVALAGAGALVVGVVTDEGAQ